MKSFERNGIQFNIPERIEELLFWQYIEYSNLSKKQMTQDDLETPDGFEHFIKIIELFCGLKSGSLENMDYISFSELSKEVSECFNLFADNSSSMKEKLNRSFTIDNVLYVTKTEQEMNQLTLGEIITIKTLQKDSNSSTDILYTMAALLIRPGKVEVDSETGKELYIQDEFDRKDLFNLEYRKNLFKEKARVVDMMPVINFFLSGIQI